MNNDYLGKSPKMWVNEICVKQLTQAKWDTKDAFPGRVPPTFICRCAITYSDKVLEVDGSGKTKKDAEQEAAREMLKILEMTPAKLLALNMNSNAAKKKASRQPSSSPISAERNTGEGSVDAEGCEDVSDTDDAELNLESNPIGDLLAACSTNGFEDPIYLEVNVEGPSHKRIFTIACKVDELNLNQNGRRYKKQTAKKLAAFRVLREMKKQGIECTSYGAAEDNNQTKVNIESSTKDQQELKAYVDKLPTNSNLRFGRSIGDARCNDTTGKCLEYCVNYNHAFDHLGKSETLEKIKNVLYDNPAEDTFNLLETIAVELSIGLSKSIYQIESLNNVVTFIRMKFPFNFDKVPNTCVINGHGFTTEEAESKAARAAIDFLKLMSENETH